MVAEYAGRYGIHPSVADKEIGSTYLNGGLMKRNYVPVTFNVVFLNGVLRLLRTRTPVSFHQNVFRNLRRMRQRQSEFDGVENIRQFGIKRQTRTRYKTPRDAHRTQVYYRFLRTAFTIYIRTKYCRVGSWKLKTFSGFFLTFEQHDTRPLSGFF